MLGYVIRRLFLAVFVLWGAVTVVFIVVRLVPADPALLIAGESATEEQLDELRTRLGLDQPLIVQYGSYLWDVLRGDLGDSYTQAATTTELIAQVLPNTALLATLACLLALAVSFPLGLLAALRVNTVADRLITTLSLLTQSLPGFWVGVVLTLIFARQLNWLPASELESPRSLILPTITLALPFIAILIRMVRSGLIEV
ncbi:MAG: ABC transporter permease, partial [Beutenbergiaceae bacterium]